MNKHTIDVDGKIKMHFGLFSVHQGISVFTTAQLFVVVLYRFANSCFLCQLFGPIILMKSWFVKLQITNNNENYYSFSLTYDKCLSKSCFTLLTRQTFRILQMLTFFYFISAGTFFTITSQHSSVEHFKYHSKLKCNWMCDAWTLFKVKVNCLLWMVYIISTV